MSSKIKPVLHYDFEHFTEDGKVEDLSGNGYHGTISGATRCEDMWGNPNSAYEFSAGRIELDISQMLSDDYSIIAIVNMFGNFNTDIISGGSTPRFYFVSNALGFNGMAWYFDEELVNNGYHVYTATRKDNTFTIFVDGDLIHQTNNTQESVFASDTILGRDSTLMKMDEFRLYDQALTPTQVKKVSHDMMRKVGRQ
jgi:hypothetical protein